MSPRARLGTLLAQLRSASNLTNVSLARSLGLGTVTLSRIESGEYKIGNSDLKALLATCKADAPTVRQALTLNGQATAYDQALRNGTIDIDDLSIPASIRLAALLRRERTAKSMTLQDVEAGLEIRSQMKIRFVEDGSVRDLKFTEEMTSFYFADDHSLISRATELLRETFGPEPLIDTPRGLQLDL